MVPAWPCSHRGLPGRRITTTPVVSYTTISPLPLVWRYVSVARSGRFFPRGNPHPGRYPAMCSVECGLSSALKSTPRPSGWPDGSIIPFVRYFVNLICLDFIRESETKSYIIAEINPIFGEVLMRKPMVAGNWKMNKTVDQASVLVQELLPGLKNVPEVERGICPPFTSLMILAAQLDGSGVGLGAQNLHWEASGAYTGEVSPQMVREFCQYVIIGHSERRTYFGETDESVNKKLKAALALGLIPIVCIGETLEEYEAGKTGEVVSRQVMEGFKEIDPSLASTIVVA